MNTRAVIPLLAGGLLILSGVLSLPTALLAQVTQAQVRIDGMT